MLDSITLSTVAANSSCCAVESRSLWIVSWGRSRSNQYYYSTVKTIEIIEVVDYWAEQYGQIALRNPRIHRERLELTISLVAILPTWKALPAVLMDILERQLYRAQWTTAFYNGEMLLPVFPHERSQRYMSTVFASL